MNEDQDLSTHDEFECGCKDMRGHVSACSCWGSAVETERARETAHENDNTKEKHLQDDIEKPRTTRSRRCSACGKGVIGMTPKVDGLTVST